MHKKLVDQVMWKMVLMFLSPMLFPFEILYGMLMKVLMPLGVPDFLGIMQTEDEEASDS